MKHKLLSLFTIIMGAYFLAGCALIFAPGKQRISITSTTPDATIVYKQDSIGLGTAKYKIKKNTPFQVVSAEKDGYKTAHHAFQLAALTPYYALTLLDIPIYLGPLWEIHANKLHKYRKHQTIPALLPMEKRKPNEKFLLVNNTSIDTKGKDVNVATYRGINNFMEKTTTPFVAKKRSKGTSREDLRIENSGFGSMLNSSLQSMNFMDTTKTMFPNTGNTMYINATIKKITFHDVAYRNTKNYSNDDHLLSVELGIDWELLDYYKQPIYTTHTDKKSDLFVLTHHYSNDQAKLITDAIEDAIQDNLTYALIDVRKELSDKKLLDVTAGTAKKEPLYGQLMLTKPTAIPNQRLNDYLKSSVSIKVDNGHGSGVVISADGYIVTNYHVIAGTKKVEVIFNDGTTMEGEVVRKNPDADLALIKVKMDGLLPLQLSDAKNPEIGVDVWAIGTPKSLELGQSVSKGIVSGIRKTNGNTMLQIDANISPGNSGGALVNKDGVVMGIVSSKLIGYGTEGIGFAILSAEVLEGLNIAYK